MMEKTPAYRRVYHAIREKIETGVYAPGTLLPPEPELEKQFAVSRTTVRHAISLLVREGRLRVRQGFGTKVLPLADHLPHYHKFHNVVEEIGRASCRERVSSPV